jgi:hypothetical protein
VCYSALTPSVAKAYHRQYEAALTVNVAETEKASITLVGAYQKPAVGVKYIERARML